MSAPEDRRSSDRRPAILLLEWTVIAPLIGWVVYTFVHDPHQFSDWRILVWASAIAVVDLLPVSSSGEIAFSLSFPIELSAALLYPPAAAALIAFVGAFDNRELRRQIAPTKALYVRGQIAFSVGAESVVFHLLASLHSRWYALGPAVIFAAVAGYSLNVLVVATYEHLLSGQPTAKVLREMHVGVFGEFVISYMGLAAFSVLVAISTQTTGLGLWSLVVFIMPLAFARQMFQRTHSLQKASEELAARQAENEFQALHDSLTGLPNRMLFLRTLADAADEARIGTGMFGVIIMDLDRFKEVNDALGHHYGDALLQEIGPRLSRVLREQDLLARLGGDEFGIVLPHLPNQDVAEQVAKRLLEELERPISVEGLLLDVSASVGIAIFPIHSAEVETLLQRADVAMYAAKQSGSGVYEFYEPSFDLYSPDRLTLISQVRPAIESEEFILYFQPKVYLQDGRVAGLEALVRWQHPQRRLIAPDEFIPLIEQTVLLRPLTTYVLNEALRQWREWKTQGIDVQVAVNLSARNLFDLKLPDQVADALDRNGAPPSALAFELTESFLLADPERSIGILDRLAGVGVDLSIDDFGTGYSSLAYLRRLPIDEIKVDRSFVMRMHKDPNDAMIVRATVDLGRNLGLRVVAEGVENAETWDQLRVLGCDVAQGYFLSKPMPASETTIWLAERIPSLQSSEPTDEAEVEEDVERRPNLRAV